MFDNNNVDIKKIRFYDVLISVRQSWAAVSFNVFLTGRLNINTFIGYKEGREINVC